jgi:hypothetical protein
VVTVDAAKNAIATYTLDPVLFTLSVTPAGAVADGGSTFAGWSGTAGCGGVGTCVVTVDAAKNAIATYTSP